MEIYRGKKKDTGEWIIGSVICIENRAFALVSPYLEPERPPYNGLAIGCGLEDREITKDGYEAAAYGWEEALEQYEENFPLWVELDPDTVTRCTGKTDARGNVFFEGDLYHNGNGIVFEICFGSYESYCPHDKQMMENVGFFVVSQAARNEDGELLPMPLGPTEEYGFLAGNIFDTPQLIQHADQEAGEVASLPTLAPGV